MDVREGRQFVKGEQTGREADCKKIARGMKGGTFQLCAILQEVFSLDYSPSFVVKIQHFVRHAILL